MKDKLTIIFIPFLLCLLTLTVGYTVINWLLFAKFQLFSFKEIIPNLIIPMIIAGLLVLFIVRPRLKILKLDEDRWLDGYSVFLWIGLMASVIMAQEYMTTATGKLTPLESINQIEDYKSSKYYTLDKFHIEKRPFAIHHDFEVSGRNSEYFNMYIYIALPIFEHWADSTTKPRAWLGIKYHEQISNRLKLDEKEIKYQKFVDKSERTFNHEDVDTFIYLERVPYSDEKDGYLKAIDNNSLYTPSETILRPINEPFEARNGNKLTWFIIVTLATTIIFAIAILIPKLDENKLDKYKSGRLQIKQRIERRKLLVSLIPQKDFFITPILIYLNIAIFLAMLVNGLGFISVKGEDLIDWGANYGPLTKSGEWWRLITNVFLHGGVMHLLLNMFGLFFVGLFLEPVLGRTKYIITYLLTGVAASIASIWWYDSTVSIGASGAIFGLYGTFVALLVTKVYPPDFTKFFLTGTLVYIGINLIAGLSEGIDNAAHIGGLVSGFIIGLILYTIMRRANDTQEE